jgi:hypothetical protein
LTERDHVLDQAQAFQFVLAQDGSLVHGGLDCRVEPEELLRCLEAVEEVLGSLRLGRGLELQREAFDEPAEQKG